MLVYPNNTCQLEENAVSQKCLSEGLMAVYSFKLEVFQWPCLTAQGSAGMIALFLSSPHLRIIISICFSLNQRWFRTLHADQTAI